MKYLVLLKNWEAVQKVKDDYTDIYIVDEERNDEFVEKLNNLHDDFIVSK